MITDKLEHEMFRAGYVTAARAADLVMVSATGTIYRGIEAGRLKGLRSGDRWFVTLRSLLDRYGSNPVLRMRIKSWRPDGYVPSKQTKKH